MKSTSWGLFERRVIGRRDSPLMTRWTLLRTPWLTLKLHRFHRSDPSCLHDHPWPFVSLILAGGYFEDTPREDGRTPPRRRWFGPGCLLVRPASWRHRVVLRRRDDGSFVEPLTLVVTGRRVREWGFWTRAKGWLPWHLFTAAEDDC